MDHREKYLKESLFTVSHKLRLNRILGIIGNLDVDEEGRFADFGCSSGYILNLASQMPKYKKWSFFGFDYSEESLHRGEEMFPEIDFNEMDLSVLDDRYEESFDFVTCFETLEHVEDYRTAFRNLYRKTKPGGKILISVPNETFLQGLIKNIGRYLRGDRYLDRKMTNTWKKKVSYVSCLITNKNIERFRKGVSGGYGHLGFDYRNLERFVDKNYLRKNKILLLSKESVFLGFYKIYLFRKGTD